MGDNLSNNSTLLNKFTDTSRLVEDVTQHPALSYSLLQELAEPFGSTAFIPSSSPAREVAVIISPSPSPPTPTIDTAIDASIPHSTPLKRRAENLDTLPPPKRAALIGKVKPHPSLSTPFKSPLMVSGKGAQFKTPLSSGSGATPSSNTALTGISGRPSTPLLTHTSRFKATEADPATESPLPSPSHSNKAKSRRPSASSASRPFKSPVIKPKNGSATSTSSALIVSNPSSSLGESLRIAALEKKLQLLKQAARIKAEDSEAQLEGLVIKWKKAAQNAAEDLWGMLKSSGDWGSGGGDGGGGDGASWGFGDDKSRQDGNRSWGYGEPDMEREAPYAQEGFDEPEYLAPPSPSVVERQLLATLNGPFKPRNTLLHATEERQGRWSRGTEFESGDCDGYPVDAPERPECDTLNRDEEVDHAKHEEKGKGSNLGGMLISMGIPPEALGWSDEEGEFVDP
ncbi:hypothetical protein FRB93_009486 [Tulasnella sp. JGI-2019a]|nr:hypothetical protein FRB93_009486 [Tulasnella sp. JGI-2019a]